MARRSQLALADGTTAAPTLSADGATAQVDWPGVLGHDQVVAIALLVPEEQVLAVRGVDAAPVLDGLFDREHRWMVVPRVCDAELIEDGERGRSGIDGRSIHGAQGS